MGVLALLGFPSEILTRHVLNLGSYKNMGKCLPQMDNNCLNFRNGSAEISDATPKVLKPPFRIPLAGISLNQAVQQPGP